MSDYYDAFEFSPVPAPGPDAVAPEPFRGIYGMPAFATIPTNDMATTIDFWTRGLGFFELFSAPDTITHLRRWAFQDVLIIPAASDPAGPPTMSVSFACVLGEVDSIAENCNALRPACADGPSGHAVEHPRCHGDHSRERTRHLHRGQAVRPDE